MKEELLVQEWIALTEFRYIWFNGDALYSVIYAEANKRPWISLKE